MRRMRNFGYGHKQCSSQSDGGAKYSFYREERTFLHGFCESENRTPTTQI